MTRGRWGLLAFALTASACAGPSTGSRDAILLGRFEATQLDGPRLRLHAIDVGQGDALLVQAPGGKTALIDSGPAGARRTLFRYLRANGVEKIDLLVHSHAHADHVGNTAALIREFGVGTVLDPGFPHTAKAYARALAAIEAAGIPVRIARRGRTVRLGRRVTLSVLAPEAPFLAGTRSDVNANSVVFRIDYGQVRILMTGDAEGETEARLLRRDRSALRAQVLKVAHHGSRFATHGPFIRAVSPTLAIISAGVNNAYRHPAKKTLSRLAAQGVAVATTARDGHVLIETDGREVSLRRKGKRRR